MQKYAEDNSARKAIWKIGEKHVQDIEKIEGSSYFRNYNLINNYDFNTKIFKYTPRRGQFKRTGFLFGNRA